MKTIIAWMSLRFCVVLFFLMPSLFLLNSDALRTLDEQDWFGPVLIPVFVVLGILYLFATCFTGAAVWLFLARHFLSKDEIAAVFLESEQPRPYELWLLNRFFPD